MYDFLRWLCTRFSPNEGDPASWCTTPRDVVFYENVCRELCGRPFSDNPSSDHHVLCKPPETNNDDAVMPQTGSSSEDTFDPGMYDRAARLTLRNHAGWLKNLFLEICGESVPKLPLVITASGPAERHQGEHRQYIVGGGVFLILARCLVSSDAFPGLGYDWFHQGIPIYGELPVPEAYIEGVQTALSSRWGCVYNGIGFPEPTQDPWCLPHRANDTSVSDSVFDIMARRLGLLAISRGIHDDDAENNNFGLPACDPNNHSYVFEKPAHFNHKMAFGFYLTLAALWNASGRIGQQSNRSINRPSCSSSPA